MNPNNHSHLRYPEPPTSNFTPWFDRGPSGRVRITSTSVRKELEEFARAARSTLGGVALQVKRQPYRHAGTTWWTFDADGPEGSVSLTFPETGRTKLPAGVPTDGTGEVADALDAHYLFEFIERELAPPTDALAT